MTVTRGMGVTEGRRVGSVDRRSYLLTSRTQVKSLATNSVEQTNLLLHDLTNGGGISLVTLRPSVKFQTSSP